MNCFRLFTEAVLFFDKNVIKKQASRDICAYTKSAAIATL